jgi:hypothetical protein
MPIRVTATEELAHDARAIFVPRPDTTATGVESRKTSLYRATAARQVNLLVLCVSSQLEARFEMVVGKSTAI